MAIKMSQGLKQVQKMVMTPQLRQAIKLLSLTHLEMSSVIAEEMVENPLLEESDAFDVSSDASGAEAPDAEDSGDHLESSTVTKDDFDWESYIDSFNSNSSTPSGISSSEEDQSRSYEGVVSEGQTLAEHLEWQARMEDMKPEDHQWILEIIHNLSDEGYLETPLEDLADRLDCNLKKMRELQRLVQYMDPVGCGSENLQECLLAQAKIAEEKSPLLEKIIRRHMGEIKNHDYKKMAQEFKVSIGEIEEAFQKLKEFHPRPGLLISNQETHYIVPDVYVVEIGGEFVVKVNDDGIPRLRVSKLYRDIIRNGKRDKKAKEYVREKLNSAMWLMKSVQNRQKTIYRVAQAIVVRQQNFFKKGRQHLRPMILKDIAGEIGVHDSTVSRVTTNKYMHTPLGLFELKYFFSTAVGGGLKGEDVSNEVVRLKIKELIENENPASPLSDQRIVDLLTIDELTVARRTVGKYRDSLGILSASKRKTRQKS